MVTAEQPPRTRRWVWGVLTLWVVLAAALVPFAGKLGDEQKDEIVSYLPGSAQSTDAARVLADMPGGDTTDLSLVYHRDDGLTADDRALAADQAREVTGLFAPVGTPVPHAETSGDGRTLVYAFRIDEDAGEPADVVADVRDVTDRHPGGLDVWVGGPGATDADMQEVFASIDGTLMIATLLVVTILLVLTYRSPFLWLVPLVCVGVAEVTTRAVVYLLAHAGGVTVTGQSGGIMTVLVFGAGTDYALLLIARYREELRRTPRPIDAMATALRGCGPALVASAGTVVAGLLCLLAADMNNLRGLGPVGAVAVVCALAVMTTLLPALLVLLGRRVFWPLIPAYGSTAQAGFGVYARIGAFVSRRPVGVVALGTVLLGALAVGTLNLPGELRPADGFTTKPDSVVAGQTLGEAFPERATQPITVVARTDRADAAVAAADATEGVADAAARRTAGGWTEIAVFATDRPESPGEEATVKRLRAVLADVDGADAAVGGPTAERMDQDTAVARDRKIVVPIVLAAVLLILIVLLRGLIGPLLLVAAVALVWAASLGLGALFFEPVFGFAGADPGLPLLSFVFLVALGVDYGIFLMHRMREEAAAGKPSDEAVVTALTATGGVIASAGFVLAATFSVLTVLPLVMMVELGFVVAVGVLLDTFLVRGFLVTGASTLLGRYVWWPGPLARREKAPAPDEPADTSPMMAR
ncbi:MMPL family transporter [Yinghuangia sp. ASG 101]|uniref:MMPL family transporter n=1 Tax=Yinghuangia sp. ASG 101 TaxID=2896848 RepID=UPI001E3FA08C|nr:MMPL family transporter [Yinghuangia sp. ASG 101]UGQ08962.1 MMPL family transporter [Yinghuangia sp. ASG 101]